MCLQNTPALQALVPPGEGLFFKQLGVIGLCLALALLALAVSGYLVSVHLHYGRD